MDNERAGNPYYAGCIVRAEFPVFGEHGDSLALKEATKGGLKQGRSLYGQLHDLILAGLAPDPNLDLIALSKLAKRFGRLAILV
jgi:hypothetical protein